MPRTTTTAIILAAGQGTRMKSGLPKVLHEVAGKPMLFFGVAAALEAGADDVVVVVGHGAERVTKKLQEQGPDEVLLDFVEQHVQRGTGDAASVGLTAFPDDELDEAEGDVLVLPGDTPLLRPATIAALVAAHRRADPRLIHVCGDCKTLHFAEGGRLRPLTPAERFALEVEVPHLVRAAVFGTYAPSAVPTATLFVGDR